MSSTSTYLPGIKNWILQSPPAEWALTQTKDLLIGALRQGPIPQHIAFVMDGNRRYARSRKIETVEGHNLGFEALAKILEVCYKAGVKCVTIYAFSIENFKRSKYEVDALMSLAKVKLAQLAQHGAILQRYGARIQFSGQRDLLQPDVQAAIRKVEEMTKTYGDAVLNVCGSYTSQNEITNAVQGIVEEYSVPLQTIPEKGRTFSEAQISQRLRSRHLAQVSNSESSTRSPSTATSSHTESEESSVSSSTSTLHPSTPAQSTFGVDSKEREPKEGEANGINYADIETISASTIDSHMFTAGMPPLDLIVRTSGVQRLSDFMLWQGHQNTELAFLDCMWPEFDLWKFLPVLVSWQWRQRVSRRRTIFA